MTNTTRTINKFKKVVLSIAIALLTVFFVNQGIEVFYPSPERCEYEPFPKTCDEDVMINESLSLKEECEEKEGRLVYDADCSASCDTCQTKYEEKEDRRDGRVFVFLVILSAAFLIAGMLLKAESVSNGLLIASVMQLVIVSIRYWSSAEELQRFLFIGAVLAVLIVVGYRKVK